MNKVVKDNKDKIMALMIEHKIVKAYLFGSALSDDNFTDESDTDFVINFREGLDSLENGELWWSLYYKLKDLLKREVDLLIERSLKNVYFIKELNTTKELFMKVSINQYSN
jgi:predicted nucleotidyltransferase